MLECRSWAVRAPFAIIYEYVLRLPRATKVTCSSILEKLNDSEALGGLEQAIATVAGVSSLLINRFVYRLHMPMQSALHLLELRSQLTRPEELDFGIA